MYNFYILKLRVLRVIFLWGLLGMMCMIRILFIFIGFVSLTIMTGSKNILSRNCRWMLGKCSCWLGRLRKIRIGVWHVLGIVSGILGLSTLQSTLYLVICIIILFIFYIPLSSSKPQSHTYSTYISSFTFYFIKFSYLSVFLV